MTNDTDIIALIREKDTYAHKLGIKIIEAKDGKSHVTMMLDESTANAVGNVHGGVIFSLADIKDRISAPFSVASEYLPWATKFPIIFLP